MNIVLAQFVNQLLLQILVSLIHMSLILFLGPGASRCKSSHYDARNTRRQMEMHNVS